MLQEIKLQAEGNLFLETKVPEPHSQQELLPYSMGDLRICHLKEEKFQNLPLVILIFRGVANSPVGSTECRIQHDEDKELLVEQFVDTPFPSEEKLGEATEASIGYFQGV